jgi:hypothetical protein
MGIRQGNLGSAIPFAFNQFERLHLHSFTQPPSFVTMKFFTTFAATALAAVGAFAQQNGITINSL